MSPEKATAMKRNLKLGRNTYMEIVKNVGPHALPSRYSVKKHEDSIKIPLTEFMGGYKADLKEAIRITIQRILKLKEFSDEDCAKLRVKLSVGFDGSGSHLQRAGKDSAINTQVFLILQ